MNQIKELPEPRDYGLDFNYAAWTPGTKITLCNVKWDSTYRDVWFNPDLDINEYLDTVSGPKVTLENLSYARPNEPIRIDLPFNAVYRYNYVRVYNPAQPINGDTPRFFYYFINDVRYLTPNTTEIVVQLDIWQSWIREIALGNCFINQSHWGIAAENGFDDYGREHLTVPEGLDIGGEYRIMAGENRREIASAYADVDGEIINGQYEIMVLSAVNLAISDPGTMKDPKLETGPGTRWEGLPNGATVYIFNDVQFDNFVTEFRDKPWITQGILDISIIPTGGTYWDSSEGVQVWIGETSFATIPTDKALTKEEIPMMPNWRESADLLPARYAHLKKFLTYPYCVLELTSYTGTPLMLKPESWADPDARVIEAAHLAPPNPRIAFYPYRYNASGVDVVRDSTGVVNDGGEFLDMTTGIFNFPHFSLVNDGYMSYMASNAHGIAYQYQSADWSQQRAMTAARTAYDQAGSGIDTSRAINEISVDTNNQQMHLANQIAGANAVMNGVGRAAGAIGGGGGPVKAGLGIASAGAQSLGQWAIQSQQNMMGTAIQNSQLNRSNDASVGNMNMVRDSNRGFAEYAAKGDYENTIAGTLAKLQDAKLIQPTTSGQVGGDAFLLSVYKWGYDLKIKMLGGAAMRQVGEYWLRYGYQMNRFGTVPNDYAVMSHFTYWKLKETYVTSANCPEFFKQAIRGIFEKGVTVWRNPDHIGSIDLADNTPLEGIVL